MKDFDKRRSDRKLIGFLLLLICVETFWLLQRQGNLSFLSTEKQKLAGSFVEVTENVKKRSSGSFTWSETSVEDPIYYHDAILTSSQSRAEIVLNDNTEITLSEGTLITIEPPDSLTDNKILIQVFTADQKRKFLKDRVIEKPSTFVVEKGSDIDLRIESQQLQATVYNGDIKTAAARSPAEEFTITLVKDTQPRRIKPRKAKKKPVLAKNAAAKTAAKPKAQLPNKLPSKTVTAKVIPENLKAQLPTKLPKKKFSKLPKDIPSKLPEKTVTTVDVPDDSAVVLAPVVAPSLPSTPSAEKLIEQVEVVQTPPKKSVPPPEEEETEVALPKKAVEEEVSVVLPKEEPPLVIPPKRKELDVIDQEFMESELSAPKLKKPRIRQPSSASKRSSNEDSFRKMRLLASLLNRAHAAESAEVLLEWEKINKAKAYWIEISIYPSFTRSVIRQKVTEPSYIWQTSVEGNYYWRVQAESVSGKLGKMSEVDSFEIRRESGASEVDVLSGDTSRNDGTVGGNVSALTGSSSADDLSRESVNAVAPMEKPRFDLYWSPVYRVHRQAGSQNVDLTLRGSAATSLALSSIWDATQNGHAFYFFAQATNFEWKPESDHEYPFQPPAKITEVRADLVYHDLATALGYGVVTQTMIKPERVSVERVDLTPVQAFGLTSRYLLSPQTSTQGSLLIGDNLWRAQIRLQYLDSGTASLRYGGYFEGSLDSVADHSGSQLSIGIFLGYGF